VNTLGQGACLVSFLAGDIARCSDYAALLDEHAGRHGIALWQAWARCLDGALRCRRGDAEAGMRLLRDELTEHPHTRQLPRNMVLLGELAQAHSARGEHDAALGAIGEALERAERHEERWYLPELMRIHGSVLQAVGG